VAVEISEKLSSEQYHIIFKLHPGEYSIWETRYPWLKNDKIEVIASRERNLYEYLAISDVQVGVYSTAIYEGLGFGLQTFIYDAPHANTMQYLLDEGYAELVKSSDELVTGIQQKTEKTKEGNDFWKSDALENMLAAIRKLV
jgi:CDP-glycerol glycerophosphotransferase (TagB/SpsB family)